MMTTTKYTPRKIPIGFVIDDVGTAPLTDEQQKLWFQKFYELRETAHGRMGIIHVEVDEDWFKKYGCPTVE